MGILRAGIGVVYNWSDISVGFDRGGRAVVINLLVDKK